MTTGIDAIEGEAIGRSRGGLSSKIHLAVDGLGRPLAIRLTEGQAGDNPQLLPLLDEISVNTPGPGRPRKRPVMLLADRGYAHDSTRQALRRRRIRHAIPAKNRPTRWRKRRGRTPAFDADAYKGRNVVERCFNRLKHCRDLATRYAKRAILYRAELVIAAIMIWLHDSQDRP